MSQTGSNIFSEAYYKPSAGSSRARVVLIGAALLAVMIAAVLVLVVHPSTSTPTAPSSVYHGKAKKNLVIVDEADLVIDSPAAAQRSVHYIHGGEKDPLFVLIHGQSRKLQNAGHWQAHFDLFDTLGTFVSVDLPGHGRSVPGPSGERGDFSVFQQADFVHELLDRRFQEYRSIVLVSRGWGCNVALELAKKMQSRLKGLVLIAPLMQQHELDTIPNFVMTTPTLLVWAKDDPVARFEQHEALTSVLTKVQPWFIERVATDTLHPFVAHTPENILIYPFQNAVHDFVQSTGLLR